MWHTLRQGILEDVCSFNGKVLGDDVLISKELLVWHPFSPKRAEFAWLLSVSPGLSIKEEEPALELRPPSTEALLQCIWTAMFASSSSLEYSSSASAVSIAIEKISDASTGLVFLTAVSWVLPGIGRCDSSPNPARVKTCWIWALPPTGPQCVIGVFWGEVWGHDGCWDVLHCLAQLEAITAESLELKGLSVLELGMMGTFRCILAAMAVRCAVASVRSWAGSSISVCKGNDFVPVLLWAEASKQLA